MFAYDDAITERFPTIRAGVIHATGLGNRTSSPGLLDEYRAEQQAASERLNETAIADVPSLAAWRRAFTLFGAKPTQYRNATEALLRRLSRHGDIPSINTLVDIGNLVSIRYAMPVAVFDQANIAGPTTVRFATGAESFTDLGSTAIVHPEPGEVIFVDEDDDVCARRWCWRQSAGSATGATTTEALIVVEGHHETASKDVESALADLTSLLASYQPQGQMEPYLLSPTNPCLTGLRRELRAAAEPERVPELQRFFKTDPGGYGEGDIFLGARVPAVRAIARRHAALGLEDVTELLRSPLHEERLAALVILVGRFGRAEEGERRRIFACSRRVLDRLVRSPSVWERRIAIMATFAFVRANEYVETLRLARLLLDDEHDLIHKATGWMLREVGKRDEGLLVGFLERHASDMPRTMLRYAVERLDAPLRASLMSRRH